LLAAGIRIPRVVSVVKAVAEEMMLLPLG
jgi:hypothetical protein